MTPTELTKLTELTEHGRKRAQAFQDYKLRPKINGTVSSGCGGCEQDRAASDNWVEVQVQIRSAQAVWGSVTGNFYGVVLPRQRIKIDPRDLVDNEVATVARSGPTPFKTGDSLAALANLWPWKPKKCKCKQMQHHLNMMGPRWLFWNQRKAARSMAGKWWFLLVPFISVVCVYDLARMRLTRPFNLAAGRHDPKGLGPASDL